jgi:hypothetical protein
VIPSLRRTLVTALEREMNILILIEAVKLLARISDARSFILNRIEDWSKSNGEQAALRDAFDQAR